MKRMISLCCAGLMAFSLAACGSQNATSSTSTPQVTSSVVGKITALDGTTATLQLGELTENQPGDPPSQDGPQPSGDNANGDSSASGQCGNNLTWTLDNGVLSIHLNIRTPATANVETIHAQLCSLMTENGFEEAEAKIKAPLYVPSDSVLVQKLSAAFEGMTGEKAYTRTISGGTYAKEMPNVVAFGPNWPGELPLIHRANEYMELEKLKKHVRITAAAMYELAR